MMKNKKNILLFLSTLFPFFLMCQGVVGDDMKTYEELNLVKKDSITVECMLMDFNLGKKCGKDLDAGIFLFKITKAPKKFKKKKIVVIIQCANNNYAKSFYEKNKKYR